MERVEFVEVFGAKTEFVYFFPRGVFHNALAEILFGQSLVDNASYSAKRADFSVVEIFVNQHCAYVVAHNFLLSPVCR